MKKLEKLTLKELANSSSVLDVAEARGIIGGSDLSFYALSYVGQCEISGSDANANIVYWLGGCANLTQAEQSTDETPWCSAYVNGMVGYAGGVGTNNALASSWSTWGCADTAAHKGDIAVSPDGHHVGIITSIVDGVIYMTSGNNGVSGCVQTYGITSAGYSYRSPY